MQAKFFFLRFTKVSYENEPYFEFAKRFFRENCR